MYTINQGTFKHKIELLEHNSLIDHDNIASTEWIVILSCRARIRNNISKEIEVEHGTRFSSTKKVTIRYPKHLPYFDSEDSNRYRLKYNNNIYNIISMSDIQEENKYLEMIISLEV
ncbi:MAG: head-tail adaptor protein [Fusobacterium necrophorum]|nr:head-tail adaptor protein [Fusobacterium necrophorum]